MEIRNDFRRFSTFRDGSHQNWQPLLHYLIHGRFGLGDLLLDFLADLLLARGDALFFFPLLGSAFIPEELGGDLSAPLVAGPVTSLVAFETEDCFSGEEGDAERRSERYVGMPVILDLSPFFSDSWGLDGRAGPLGPSLEAEVALV